MLPIVWAGAALVGYLALRKGGALGTPSLGPAGWTEAMRIIPRNQNGKETGAADETTARNGEYSADLLLKSLAKDVPNPPPKGSLDGTWWRGDIVRYNLDLCLKESGINLTADSLWDAASDREAFKMVQLSQGYSDKSVAVINAVQGKSRNLNDYNANLKDPSAIAQWFVVKAFIMRVAKSHEHNVPANTIFNPFLQAAGIPQFPGGTPAPSQTPDASAQQVPASSIFTPFLKTIGK